jgi:hypothetical protein
MSAWRVVLIVVAARMVKVALEAPPDRQGRSRDAELFGRQGGLRRRTDQRADHDNLLESGQRASRQVGQVDQLQPHSATPDLMAGDHHRIDGPRSDPHLLLSVRRFPTVRTARAPPLPCGQASRAWRAHAACRRPGARAHLRCGTAPGLSE